MLKWWNGEMLRRSWKNPGRSTKPWVGRLTSISQNCIKMSEFSWFLMDATELFLSYYNMDVWILAGNGIKVPIAWWAWLGYICPALFLGWLFHGPRLNIKTVFPRYGDSHVKHKTVARPSYLQYGGFYTGKTIFLYSDAPPEIRSCQQNHILDHQYSVTIF